MDETEEIRQEIEGDKDAHIAILRDTLEDLRGHNRFVKKVCVMLFCLVVGLVVSIVGSIIGLHVYDQQKFTNFLLEYEYTTENTISNADSDNCTNSIMPK